MRRKSKKRETMSDYGLFCWVFINDNFETQQSCRKMLFFVAVFTALIIVDIIRALHIIKRVVLLLWVISIYG
ncbi:MAG: hypothetical protein OEZ40_11025 [Candidatus Bathyarchaeota archaeon]|nr:hypothetical protein [Candidatus Bathyarchaeota archaeon]